MRVISKVQCLGFYILWQFGGGDWSCSVLLLTLGGAYVPHVPERISPYAPRGGP